MFFNIHSVDHFLIDPLYVIIFVIVVPLQKGVTLVPGLSPQSLRNLVDWRRGCLACWACYTERWTCARVYLRAQAHAGF